MKKEELIGRTLAVCSGGRLAHWPADANTAIPPLSLFGAMPPTQKPPETARYVLHLCTSSAWRKVLGMLPRFKRSDPGRRWGACRMVWAWGCSSEPDCPESILLLRPFLPFSCTRAPRFLPRCCCTGAPSSANISYSKSLRQQNKCTDTQAAKAGSWICQGQPAFQNACITNGKWDRSKRSGMFLYYAGITEMQKGILCAVYATGSLLVGWIGILIILQKNIVVLSDAY